MEGVRGKQRPKYAIAGVRPPTARRGGTRQCVDCGGPVERPTGHRKCCTACRKRRNRIRLQHGKPLVITLCRDCGNRMVGRKHVRCRDCAAARNADYFEREKARLNDQPLHEVDHRSALQRQNDAFAAAMAKAYGPGAA